MDTGIMSDDDYDVISNPGSRSLGNSMMLADEVKELPATEDAQDRYETTRWSATEIQAFVRKGMGVPPTALDNRRVRVYVDGSFDVFDVGHALQLRQAKLAFPAVHLIVGVFSDDILQENNVKHTWSEVDRIELVRHCRWVDEVVDDAPYAVTQQYLKSKRIDFVAIDEGSSCDPACDKVRVNAYDLLKKEGVIFKTRRTVGLSSRRSRLTASPEQRATPTLTSPTSASGSPEFTQHVDIYGIGF